MLLALDVHYKETYAKVVGVIFNWDAAEPNQIVVTQTTEVAEYVPGEFYKRELPCLLQLIAEINIDDIEAIIVDGHVFVDNDGKHGLGGYLSESLDGKIPVIGVAKRAFHANEQMTVPVLRGESANPLYVSAIGMEKGTAAAKIEAMHGEYRIPTILQILDTETKRD